MTIARDGLREIAVSSVFIGGGAIAAAWAALRYSPWLWLLCAILAVAWLFTVAFFRDPHRVIPTDAGLLVSPADGTVTEVTHLEGHEYIDGPALRISIFLSVFDVHVNRAPCAGRVIQTKYRRGEFLDARHLECGIRNEAMTILMEPERGIPGPVIVRQVAGLIARRIVCRLAAETRVERGDRIGLIKFGSRTELIMPDRTSVEVLTKKGDHVQGGQTVLVRVRSESAPVIELSKDVQPVTV